MEDEDDLGLEKYLKTQHKRVTKNRYKFRRLQEQVDDAKVNVSRELKSDLDFVAHGEEDELKECFFKQRLVTEHEIDRTAGFKAFFKEVDPFAQSLPLIVHNVSRIVDLICKHLELSNSKLSILVMVEMLAKDCQQELCPYLSKLFTVILGLVDVADVALCTGIFRCIGNVLQEEAKHIADNDSELAFLRPYYTLALGHRRDFIRKFAGEAFAPLLRQLPPKVMKKQLKRLICSFACGKECKSRALEQQTEIVDGVAQLLFNMLRNIQQTLHSRASEILEILFSLVRPRKTKKVEDEVDEEILGERIRCIHRCLELTMDYTRRGTSNPIFDALLGETAKGLMGGYSTFLIGKLYFLLHFAVTYRGCSRADPKITGNILTFLEKSQVTKVELVQGDKYLIRQLTNLIMALWKYEKRGGRGNVANEPCKKMVLDLILHDESASSKPQQKKKSKNKTKQQQQHDWKFILELLQDVVKYVDGPYLLKEVNFFAPLLEAGNSDICSTDSEILKTVAFIVDCIGDPSFSVKSSEVDQILKVALQVLQNQSSSPGLLLASLTCFKLHEMENVKEIVQFIETTKYSHGRDAAVKLIALKTNWSKSGNEKHKDKLISLMIDSKSTSNVLQDADGLTALAKLIGVEEGDYASTKMAHKIVESHLDTLIFNLTKPSHKLRLASLEIIKMVVADEALMVLPMRREKGDDISAVKDEPVNFLDKLIDMERMELSFQTERPRQLIFGQLEAFVRSRRLNDLALRIMPAFCIGQLYVKFRPIWKMTGTTLAAFSKSYFQKYLWPVLWDHLLYITAQSDYEKEETGNDENEDQEEGEQEEQKQQEDDEGEGELEDVNVKFQATKFIDVFAETCNIMSSIGKQLESYADDIALLFFTFLRDEYYLCRDGDDLDEPKKGEDEKGYLDKIDKEIPSVSPYPSRRVTTAKVTSWIKVIGSFTKFKPCERTDLFCKIMIRFLIKTDKDIQKLSLKCLLRMKLAYLHGHDEVLNGMTEEERYRDTITRFSLSEVPKEQRQGFLVVVTRLLYGRLLTRHRKTNKDNFNMASRRASVFAFLSGVDGPEEILPLMNILFRGFPGGIDFTIDPKNPGRAVEDLHVELIKPVRLVGFVQTLEELLKQLGTLLVPYLDRILCPLFALLSMNTSSSSSNGSDDDDDDEKDGSPRMFKQQASQIRVESLRRLAEFFTLYPDHEMSPWGQVFKNTMTIYAQRLPSSVINSKRSPALLNMVEAIAQNEKHRRWAFRACPLLLSETLRCLTAGLDSARGAGFQIISCIYNIVEILVEQNELSKGDLVILLDAFLTRLERNADRSITDDEQNNNSISDARKRSLTMRRQLAKKELDILCKVSEFQVGRDKSEVSPELEETCLKLVNLLAQFLGSATANAFNASGASLKSIHNQSSKFGLVGQSLRREDFEGKRDLRNVVLTSICGLLRLVQSTDPSAFLQRFARYFGVCGIDPIYDGETRANLVSVYEILAEKADGDEDQESLTQLQSLLRDLNSWDQHKLGVFDFDLRLGAYEKLSSGDSGLTKEMYLPLVHQALFDMNEDEYPLRAAASNFLVKTILKKEYLTKLVVPVVVPGVRAGLKTTDMMIRKGFMNLLSDIVTFGADNGNKLDSEMKESLFADLEQVRDSEEPEHDFFVSMIHVQAYRQSSYLAYLRGKLNSGEIELTSTSLVHVVLPLTLHILLESSNEKHQHMKDEGILMIGEIARLFDWGHYISLLKYLLVQVSQRDIMLAKRILKAAGSVIDQFHFEMEPHIEQMMGGKILTMLSAELTYSKQAKQPKKKKGADIELQSKKQATKTAIRVTVAVAMVKVMKLLPESVLNNNLPRLIAQIVGLLKSIALGTRKEARETLVAVAKELGPAHFHKIVVYLMDTLAEGYQVHIRGFTMFVLLDECLEMHVANLKQLRAEKGQLFGDNPEMSIDDLLKVQVCDGSLDNEVIMSRYTQVIEDELFGAIGKEKMADSDYHSRVDQLMESRTNKSHEIVELLCRAIAFLPSRSIHTLLDPIISRIYSSSDEKELRVAEEALRRVGLGLRQNQDMRIPHLLVYIHHSISSEYKNKRKKRKGDDEEEEEGGEPSRKVNLSTWLIRESETEQEKAAERVKSRNSYQDIHIVEAAPKLTGRDRFDGSKKRKQAQVSAKNSNRHMIVEHALGLLLNALKTKQLVKENENHRQMLDPFVDVLCTVMKESQASRTTVLAVRAFAMLVTWNLPSMKTNLRGVVHAIFGILKKVGFTTAKGGASASSVGASASSTAADASQECVKTLTTFLKEYNDVVVDDDELKLLVLLGQHNMNFMPRQQSTLALLRVVVERTLIVPEVYDLMTKLSSEVFASKSSNVRQMSSQVLVKFFINYPLSEKRLRQHLDLVLKNIDFEVEEGRIAGLSMLKAIVDKFPVPVLEDISQYVFFPLTIRLVNDESRQCRALVCQVIARLFARIGASPLNELMEIADRWLKIEDEQVEDRAQQLVLCRAAIQIVGIYVSVDQGSLCKQSRAVAYFDTIVDITNELNPVMLSTDVEQWRQQFLETEVNLGEGHGWLTTYQALVTLEKLCTFKKCTSKFLEEDNAKLKSFILPLLDFHPHNWVRLGASRLLGSSLAETEPEEFATKFTSEQVFVFAQILTRAIADPNMDDPLADQTVKNLVWVSSAMLQDHAITKVRENKGDDDEDEDDDDNDDDDEDDEKNKQAKNKVKSGFNWLIHRLSYLGRFKGQVKDSREQADRRQCAVFKVFAFIATQCQQEENKRAILEEYLVPILFPLLHSMNLPKMHTTFTFQAPSLAQETIELLEQVTGSNAFVRAYSAVQTKVESKKRERKIEKAQEALIDTVTASKKRSSRNKAKTRSKKRKVTLLRQLAGR